MERSAINLKAPVQTEDNPLIIREFGDVSARHLQNTGIYKGGLTNLYLQKNHLQGYASFPADNGDMISRTALGNGFDQITVGSQPVGCVSTYGVLARGKIFADEAAPTADNTVIGVNYAVQGGNIVNLTINEYNQQGNIINTRYSSFVTSEGIVSVVQFTLFRYYAMHYTDTQQFLISYISTSTGNMVSEAWNDQGANQAWPIAFSASFAWKFEGTGNGFAMGTPGGLWYLVNAAGTTATQMTTSGSGIGYGISLIVDGHSAILLTQELAPSGQLFGYFGFNSFGVFQSTMQWASLSSSPIDLTGTLPASDNSHQIGFGYVESNITTTGTGAGTGIVCVPATSGLSSDTGSLQAFGSNSVSGWINHFGRLTGTYLWSSAFPFEIRFGLTNGVQSFLSVALTYVSGSSSPAWEFATSVGSQQPAETLGAASDGSLTILQALNGNPSGSLLYNRSQDGGWSWSQEEGLLAILPIDSSIQTFCYGNGVWYAIGNYVVQAGPGTGSDDIYIAYSLDGGITWTAAPTILYPIPPNSTNMTVRSCIYASGIFLLSAVYQVSGATYYQLFYTSDPRNGWTSGRLEESYTSHGGFVPVANVNGIFYAFPDNSAPLYAQPNGMGTWTAATGTAPYACFSAYGAGGTVIAVGATSANLSTAISGNSSGFSVLSTFPSLTWPSYGVTFFNGYWFALLVSSSAYSVVYQSSDPSASWATSVTLAAGSGAAGNFVNTGTGPVVFSWDAANSFVYQNIGYIAYSSVARDDTMGVLLTNPGEIDTSYTPMVVENTKQVGILYRFNDEFRYVWLGDMNQQSPTAPAIQKISKNVYKINTISVGNLVDVTSGTLEAGSIDYNGRMLLANVASTTLVAQMVNAKYCASQDVGGRTMSVDTSGSGALAVAVKNIVQGALPTQFEVDFFVNSTQGFQYVQSTSSSGFLYIDPSKSAQGNAGLPINYIESLLIPVGMGYLYGDRFLRGDDSILLLDWFYVDSAGNQHESDMYIIGNEVTNFTVAFQLFGNVYVYDGEIVWLATITNNLYTGRQQIAIQTGLQFLCAGPDAAFFLSNFDNSIFMFNGGQSVSRTLAFQEIDAITSGAFNVMENTLVLLTGSRIVFVRDGALTTMQNLASDQVSMQIYSTAVGVIFGNNVSSWQYGFNPVGAIQPLDWQSAYFGQLGFEQHVLGRFNFILYNAAKTSTTVSLTVYSYDQGGSLTSSQKTVTIPAGKWDANGVARVRIQPQNERALGTSVSLSCQSKITLLDVAVSWDDDAPGEVEAALSM